MWRVPAISLDACSCTLMRFDIITLAVYCLIWLGLDCVEEYTVTIRYLIHQRGI